MREQVATGRTDSLDSPSPFSGGFSPNPPSRAIVQGRGSMGVTLSGTTGFGGMWGVGGVSHSSSRCQNGKCFILYFVRKIFFSEIIMSFVFIKLWTF